LSPALSWSYWNGQGWAALPVTRDELTGECGCAEFTPPTDWTQTEALETTRAYWIRARRTEPGIARVALESVTTLHTLQAPSVPPSQPGDVTLIALDGVDSSLISMVLPTERKLRSDLASEIPDFVYPNADYPDVYVRFSVLAQGPAPQPNQIILGDALRVRAHLKTKRDSNTPKEKVLQITATKCFAGTQVPPEGAFVGAKSTENSVPEDLGSSQSPTTVSRSLYFPTTVGVHTCVLNAGSWRLMEDPTAGNLSALAAGNTFIEANVINGGSSHQTGIREVAVPIADSYTLVSSETWDVQPGVPVEVIGDLELTTCTNSAADHSPCPAHATNGTFVKARSKLTVVFPENVCPQVTSEEDTYINKYQHHRKLPNAITISAETLAACGSSLVVELRLKSFAGDSHPEWADADGVGVEGRSAGESLEQLEFSVLLVASDALSPD